MALYVHTPSCTSTVAKPISLPVISLHPWAKGLIPMGGKEAPTTMDARDRMLMSTFRSNIPPQYFPSANLEKPQSCPLGGINKRSGKWSLSLLLHPEAQFQAIQLTLKNRLWQLHNAQFSISLSLRAIYFLLLFHCL